MFFYLSKILVFVLNPLVWVFALLIYSWRTKIESRKKKTFVSAIIILFFFANSFIVDEFMRAWEYETPDLKKTEKFEYAIVLGGMINYDARLQQPHFERGADRLFQTIELLQQGQVKKIIISGGSGSIEFPDHKESAILKKYLIKIGIPDSVIIVENESKNTRENAVNTKKILDSLNVKSEILLVTSSFHMRRALGCFHKAGFDNLRPYPTDRFSGGRKFGIDHCLIPNSGALDEFSLLIHEISGYIIYKILGYT